MKARFQTIEQFKAVAEFFPKGRIIPQRIMKGPRKLKHLWVFGGDAWAIPTPAGYLVAVDAVGGGCIIRGKQPRGCLVYGARRPNIKYTLVGSAYTPGGTTRFIGNYPSDDAQLESINR